MSCPVTSLPLVGIKVGKKNMPLDLVAPPESDLIPMRSRVLMGIVPETSIPGFHA